MTIHIHLFDCNCIFCGSDFPLDFFQSRNEDGPNTQSATVPQGETDPLDDYPDHDEDEDWDDEDSEDSEEDSDEEDEDDSDDDENDGDHEGEEETDKPKPNKPGDKKRLFGFLIGKHDVCVL